MRKIDWKIAFMAAVSNFAFTLDHVNIGQANSAGFLSELHLTTNGDSEQLSILGGI